MVQIEELPNNDPNNLAALEPLPPPPVVDPPEQMEEDAISMERLKNWVEEDNDGLLHKALAWLTSKTGYRKWVIWWWICGVLGLIMFRTPALAHMISEFISIATYSMKGTLSALAHRQYDEVGNWLVYWIIYQAISSLDFMAETHASYLPLKTAFVAIFHLPPFFGARLLRRVWIDPIIYVGQRDIVSVMKKAHPLLLSFVYNLAPDELERMDEHQLLDHVHLKRYNFHRTLFGLPPIDPPAPADPDSLPSTIDNAPTAHPPADNQAPVIRTPLIQPLDENNDGGAAPEPLNADNDEPSVIGSPKPKKSKEKK